MRARVTVRLKRGVLDPQGEAIERALVGLGFGGVKDVRTGKIIELELPAGTHAATAKAALKDMADKLLANPVIEDYEVEILEAATTARTA